MSKKTETTETKQPAFVQELLEYGTVTIMAKSRDALAELVNDIPADVKYAAGAVGYDMDRGVFALRIDLTSKE